MNILTNRLSDLLDETGLSGQELARLAELPCATLLRLMREGGDARLEYALRISRVVREPVESVFSIPCKRQSRRVRSGRNSEAR